MNFITFKGDGYGEDSACLRDHDPDRRLSENKAVINHDDHIGKAIYEMVDYNVSLLPVVKDNKIIGVLRSVELLHTLSSIVLEE